MERESYPFDLLFVGGGPAGLAGATLKKPPLSNANGGSLFGHPEIRDAPESF